MVFAVRHLLLDLVGILDRLRSFAVFAVGFVVIETDSAAVAGFGRPPAAAAAFVVAKEGDFLMLISRYY